MIKHTIYPDKVVATYSEGDCWHETIAEYFNLICQKSSTSIGGGS